MMLFAPEPKEQSSYSPVRAGLKLGAFTAGVSVSSAQAGLPAGDDASFFEAIVVELPLLAGKGRLM